MLSTCGIKSTMGRLCLSVFAAGAVWIATLGSATAQGYSAMAPGRLLVKFRPGVSAARTQAVVRTARASVLGTIRGIDVKVLRLPQGASEVASARALARRAEVQFAEPDWVYPPALVPNDPSFASQWHLPKIGCPPAWDTTIGAGSVVIAILDSGVNPAHQDLLAGLVAGYNAYDGNNDTSDVTGHGTPVAGSAAAVTDNGVGVAGVAWACKIMPIRICDANGYAYLSAITSGLVWAADHGARVANISYGVSSSSSTTAAAAQYFMANGGVVTAAAGNSAIFDPDPDNPYIVEVSATDSADHLASFSNTGNDIDLAAPGVSVKTTSNSGGYAYGSGTSFSAPIVAGVAALVISANPSLSGYQVQDILTESADDLGTPGWDTSYGWGRVNAARAVSLALQTPGAPTPDTTPPSVSFASPAGGSTVWGNVSVKVSASDNVGVTSVKLFLDGAQIGSATAAPYNFSWNSVTSANGSHTLKATATDAAGNASTAQITVTVNNVVADTSSPTVSISSPADGTKVSKTVSVRVNAVDNVRVEKVDLYVDGKLTSTSTTAPFNTSWNPRKAARGAHALVCKAYDAAGNAGTSQTVTVYK